MQWFILSSIIEYSDGMQKNTRYSNPSGKGNHIFVFLEES